MAIKLVDVHNRDQGKFQTENLTLFQKMETLYYRQLISNFKQYGEKING